MEENQGTTLRDALESSFVEHVETPAETPVETAEAKEERLRDEAGRFAAKPAEVVPPIDAQQPVEKPRPQRPSSWKKDYEPHWEKLVTGQPLSPEEARALAEYNISREQDFAKGVSTYKTEWERAKPLLDAIAPYQPILQQYNINPASHVRDLMAAHQALALGSPQEKQQMFMKLAQDYGVQLEGMPQQDPMTAAMQRELQTVRQEINNWKTAQQQAEDQRVREEIDAFKGNPENAHFEQVKDTMAQLLASGVAPDLKTAYDKALRLHDDIWQQEQERKAQAAEQERLLKIKETATRAKANQVSIKSATPTTGPTEGKKGRRETLEAAYDELLGGARV